MVKEKMNWRSLASRDIAKKWNASTPTYYVLDVKGVIRHKWVGSPGAKAIDMALEKLIHEAEGKGKSVPRNKKRRSGSSAKTAETVPGNYFLIRHALSHQKPQSTLLLEDDDIWHRICRPSL